MPLVVLDRDGVINADSEHYIKSPDEWHPLPGSLQAIAALTKAGWTIAVASNQSGVARGLFDAGTLASINARMDSAVTATGGRLDGVFFCPMGRMTAVTAVSPGPGYCGRLPGHSAQTSGPFR